MAQDLGGEGLPLPRHWHTHRFLEVLWNWETEPSSIKTRKALGSTRVEKEV